MKHLYKLFLLLLSVAVFASCISTDEGEKTPLCAITSFSVGSITCAVPVKTASGKDTVQSRSLSSSEMKFNIDQVKGIITTVDSMPKWINLKKVIPTFTSYGTVYALIDSYYYALTSASDSIDMTNPVKLIAMASDGISTKEYTVSFKVYKEDIDTLLWTKTASSNLNVSGKKKAIYNDGKIFIFSHDGNGNPQVTSTLTSDNGSVWTEQYTINTSIDFESIVVYKNDFYALYNGNIYKSAASEEAKTWTKVSDDTFVRLLSSDDVNIYAFNGNEIVGTNDFITWNVSGNTDIDNIPETCINSYSYTSKTNSTINIAVMTGLNTQSDNESVAWYKVTSDDPDIDQQWMYIQNSIDNPYNLPTFTDMSVARLSDALLAIGTSNTDDGEMYDYLYYSADNGITWIPQTTKYTLPNDLDAANGNAVIVGDGSRLWLIQNGENIWRGVFR